DPQFQQPIAVAISGAGDFLLSAAADPTPINDNAVTTAGQPVTIDVLANDFDPDDDGLFVASVRQPAHGTVTVNANNTVTYLPNNGFVGTDQFTYLAKDDGPGGS